MRPEVCVCTCDLLSCGTTKDEHQSNSFTIRMNVPKVHYRAASPLAPPPSSPCSSFSLSHSPPSFFFLSISRPLLYLPLASHCRTLRKAQTASDKVRMIHALLFIVSELWYNIELCYSQCFSFSLHEILGLTL